MELRPYLRRAQFYETDSMAVVHHANYVHWMEEARVDFMDQMGYPYSRCYVEEGIDFALTGIQCRYKGMVRFGDTVSITMSITHLSHARVTIRYCMRDAKDWTLRFEGESEHFFYNNRTGRPVALKRVLPELYHGLEALCVEEAD